MKFKFKLKKSGAYLRFNAFWARFVLFVHDLFAKREKPRQNVNFGDFVFFFPYLTDDCIANNKILIDGATKPDYLFGKPTLENLNMITFGQYSDLCDAVGEKNHIVAVRNIIKTLYPYATDFDIDTQDALAIFGYANFVIEETGKINKLFSSVHLEYSDQEQKAGIDELQFGVFGILDWYAKRMGITDQSQVLNERWVRIYQCMKNDTAEAEYNRKLQKVYEQEAKLKHH